nr:hypothetical protein [Planctomycetota bacterium]
MARRTHSDDTLAGIGWFLVIVAIVIGAYLLFLKGPGSEDDLFSGGLEVELRADIAEARSSGRADDWEDDATLLRQTADVIEGRVLRLGIEPVKAVVEAPDRIRVRLPAAASMLTPEMKSAMTGTDDPAAKAGALAMRLVVEKAEWTNEDLSYDEYLSGEVLRWQQAQVDGGAYTPGVLGYAIVMRQGTDGTEAWHFAVVQDAANATELFFGSAMLERPTVRAADGGRQTMRFRIKGPLSERFRAFTETHQNRRLAILVDGELVMAPVLSEPLDGALEITLDRRLSREAALSMAKRWVGSGPMRVRCFYVSEKPIP